MGQAPAQRTHGAQGASGQVSTGVSGWGAVGSRAQGTLHREAHFWEQKAVTSPLTTVYDLDWPYSMTFRRAPPTCPPKGLRAGRSAENCHLAHACLKTELQPARSPDEGLACQVTTGHTYKGAQVRLSPPTERGQAGRSHQCY